MQQLHDSIWLEPVEVERHHTTKRLRQVTGLIADLEREQQVPACQDATKLREGHRQVIQRGVDDGIPRDDADSLTFARALRANGVPMPEIAQKLTIKTGKNAGQHPSVASLYRALADDSAADEVAC